MEHKDIIESRFLGTLTLNLIEKHSVFKDELKSLAPDIASEIESASTNPNCTCRSKVIAFAMNNNALVGNAILKFATDNNLLKQITEDLIELDETELKPEQVASGRVAKTTIAGWGDFVRNMQEAKLSFRQISTSVVGDDVYVFFI